MFFLLEKSANCINFKPPVDLKQLVNLNCQEAKINKKSIYLEFKGVANLGTLVQVATQSAYQRRKLGVF